MKSFRVLLVIMLLLTTALFAQENVAPPLDEKNPIPQNNVLDQKEGSSPENKLQSPSYNLDVKEIAPEPEKLPVEQKAPEPTKEKALTPQVPPKEEKPKLESPSYNLEVEEIIPQVEETPPPAPVVEEKKLKPPQIGEIYFGDRKYQELGEAFIVSNKAKIKFKVEGKDGFAADKVSLAIDENTADSKGLGSHDLAAIILSGAQDNPTAAEFEYNFKEKGIELKEGEHTLVFKASNAGGAAQATAKVSVYGGPPKVIKTPLAYPNPAKIQDQKVVLQYQLSSDAKIAVYILSSDAALLRKYTFDSGQKGGSAGYNNIVWDLKTDQGGSAGGGVYLFNVVDLDQQKVLNKGKITLVY